MAEQYTERIHSEHAVLDIGQHIGALVIYTKEELRGKEIQVSLKGTNSARMVHTAVWERRVNGRSVFAGIYPALPAGDYIIWTHPSSEITIVGGSVAEVDLCHISDIYVPYAGHSHRYDQNAPDVCATAPRDATRDLLPPRSREGKVVSTAPMGSAPMRYSDDGQVAWDQMWTDFCDLALAGGPPHRGTLLEPVDPEEVRADPDAYERVVDELECGFRLVTGLSTVRSESLGWIGLKCEDEEMALWLLRAIVVENICVRREGSVLFLPAGPAFRLEKEIKNVITVVAKTHHYWTEHRSSSAAPRDQGPTSASCPVGPTTLASHRRILFLSSVLRSCSSSLRFFSTAVSPHSEKLSANERTMRNYAICFQVRYAEM